MSKPPATKAEANLSAKHIRAIGLLSAEWGYAESSFETLLWALAGSTQFSGGNVSHNASVTGDEN